MMSGATRAADAIRQPAEQRGADAPSGDQRRGERGGRGARNAVGGLEKRHAPQAGESRAAAPTCRGRSSAISQVWRWRRTMPSPRQHVAEAALAAPLVAHGRPGGERRCAAPPRGQQQRRRCASRRPRPPAAAAPGRIRRRPCRHGHRQAREHGEAIGAEPLAGDRPWRRPG